MLKKAIRSALIDKSILKEVSSVRSIGQGIDNKNFYVYGDENKFFLKVYQTDDLDEINYEIEILRELKNKNNRNMFFPTIRNEMFFINQKPAVLFDYIPGKSLLLKDINSPILRKVASVQAGMHYILSNYKPINEKFRFPIFDFSFPKSFTIDNPSLQSMINVEANLLEDESKTINKINFKKSIIHEDLNTENIILGDDGEVSFVDFSDSHYAEIISDIATSIKELILNKKGLDFNLMKDYLDSYQKVSPIENIEISLLPFLLRRRTVFMITYLSHKQNRDKDIKIKKRINRELEVLKILKNNEKSINNFIEGYYYEN